MAWVLTYNQPFQISKVNQGHIFDGIWICYLNTDETVDQGNNAEDQDLSCQTPPSTVIVHYESWIKNSQ